MIETMMNKKEVVFVVAAGLVLTTAVVAGVKKIRKNKKQTDVEVYKEEDVVIEEPTETEE